MSYKININLRNQVFYLIKKYTSFYLFKMIFELNEKFVNAVEFQLRNPSKRVLTKLTQQNQERHENEFIGYLEIIGYMEIGLDQLLNIGPNNETYSLFFHGGMLNTLFGRYGNEYGLEDDIFYQELGMKSSNGNPYQVNTQEKYIKNILDSSKYIEMAANTLFEGEYVIPNTHKIYNKWNYESLFGASHWPLFRDYPADIESAPDFNLDPDDEVTSGEEITTAGIYEPWFSEPVYRSLSHDPAYNPYVGCLNYFLDGAVATQYQLEGTEDFYKVKWRLIWADRRYIDGQIPQEEHAYNFDLSLKHQSELVIFQRSIKAISGQPCPETGYWITPAKPDQRQYIQQGELLPTLNDADWGEVYWYLEVTNRQ